LHWTQRITDSYDLSMSAVPDTAPLPLVTAPCPTTPGEFPAPPGLPPRGGEVDGAPPVACGTAPGAAAARPRRAKGIALMLTSSIGNQVGAGIGAGAFPVLGPTGVVAIRQVVTAIFFGLTVRPRLRRLTRGKGGSLRPVIGLALTLCVMNMGLYTAVDRLGLGLAVTLEFLGPLTVALASSRKLLDLGCAALAGVGVLLLTHPGPSSDLIGLGAGVLSGLGWGLYIVFNRQLGSRLPGLTGTAAASVISGCLWLPVGVWWFVAHPPAPDGLALALLAALVCTLLCSVLPYVSDLLALRWVPPQSYGVFASLAPVWAALAGWIMLGQSLTLGEGAGIGVIVAGNVIVSVRGLLLARGGAEERRRVTPGALV
jgi:inner membrane transporter RhtA